MLGVGDKDDADKNDVDKDNVDVPVLVHVIVYVDAGLAVGVDAHVHLHLHVLVHVHVDADCGCWGCSHYLWLLLMSMLMLMLLFEAKRQSSNGDVKAGDAEAWKRGVAVGIIGSGEETWLHPPRPRSSRNRSKQIAVATMQHRAGVVERYEAARNVALHDGVWMCLELHGRCRFYCGIWFSRHVPSETSRSFQVFFFNANSSLDQDRRRTNPIAPTTITEMSERKSTKLIEVEIERKEEKAMVCGHAVHMITCVAGKEAVRRLRHDGFFFFERCFTNNVSAHSFPLKKLGVDLLEQGKR